MDLCGMLIFRKIGIQKHALVYASALPMVLSSWMGIPSTTSFVPGGFFVVE
jgi:NADH:ubiquinone oxidoreductase subunit 2 (subunit N)